MNGTDDSYERAVREGYKHVRFWLFLLVAFGIGTLVPSVGDIIRRCTQ